MHALAMQLVSFISNWESLVGSVIQAIGMVKFEDGLKTGVLPWPLEWLHQALDQCLTPLEVRVGPGGSVIVIGTLLSDQIPDLLSSARWWC